jgi:hypothetical protein
LQILSECQRSKATGLRKVIVSQKITPCDIGQFRIFVATRFLPPPFTQPIDLVIMPEPLPINPYLSGNELFVAYTICLQHETGFEMQGRLLGYLLIHIPTTRGRIYVAREIIGCKSQSDLSALAQHYINHFIRPCGSLIAYQKEIDLDLIYLIVKQQKERTPIPSSHPSRQSFETTKVDIMKRLKETPRNHMEAKNWVSPSGSWIVL